MEDNETLPHSARKTPRDSPRKTHDSPRKTPRDSPRKSPHDSPRKTPRDGEEAQIHEGYALTPGSFTLIAHDFCCNSLTELYQDYSISIFNKKALIILKE